MFETLDTKLLGNPLGAIVDDYVRMREAEPLVRQKHAAAHEAVRAAKEADKEGRALAVISGKPFKSEAVPKAEHALDDAKAELEAAERAVTITRDRLLAHVRDHREEYQAKVEQAIKATRQAALNRLEQVDQDIERLEVLAGHANWIKRPVKGEGQVDGPKPIPLEATSDKLRNAITGARPPKTQADWGIPVDAVPDDGFAYSMRNAPKQGVRREWTPPTESSFRPVATGAQDRLMAEMVAGGVDDE